MVEPKWGACEIYEENAILAIAQKISPIASTADKCQSFSKANLMPNNDTRVLDYFEKKVSFDVSAFISICQNILCFNTKYRKVFPCVFIQYPIFFCEQLICFLRIYRTLWKFRKLRRFESLDRTFRKSDCQLFWSKPSFTIHHLANLTFQHYHHNPPHCHHWHPLP